jgi:hypothetical protein
MVAHRIPFLVRNRKHSHHETAEVVDIDLRDGEAWPVRESGGREIFGGS